MGTRNSPLINDAKTKRFRIVKFLISALLLFFVLTGCDDCYDERDYKAKFADMQMEGVRECGSKGMKHLSTNLVSLEDDWIVSCYTSSPPRTYGFSIKG